MKSHKICGCVYNTYKDSRKHLGLYILDRKTNTSVILDKRLNRVYGVKECTVCCDSMGCTYFDLYAKDV